MLTIMATRQLSADRRELEVTRGQAFALARAWNLCGFAAFVPGWTEPETNEDAGVKAANLLTEANCDRGSAHDALNFLSNAQKGAKTPQEKEIRRVQGAAVLFKMAAAPKVTASKPAMAPKVAAGQLSPENIAAELKRLENFGKQ